MDRRAAVKALICALNLRKSSIPTSSPRANKLAMYEIETELNSISEKLPACSSVAR